MKEIEVKQVESLPSDINVTGVLENWKPSADYRGGMEGNIYGDKKGRFFDGQFIYTSTALHILLLPDGTKYLRTRYSLYRLI